MLSHAPVVQPPVWSEPFHVFMDASDMAIGSALMQCTPPTWYRPVYYASRRLSTAEKNVVGAIFSPNIMQVFLDDFAVYGHRLEHMTQLRLCLDRCRQARLSLNPAKCAFLVTSGNLLGHIVNQEGIAMDPDKVKAILNAPAPSNAKALSRFLGQIRWHSRMIRHLADFTTPLHAAVHRLPFQWMPIKDTTYQNLKQMLSHAPVVQPPV